jgi:hypothetical protein
MSADFAATNATHPMLEADSIVDYVLESLALKNLQLAPLHRFEDGINAVRQMRRGLFYNTRTIELACKRRHGARQQLVGGGLRMCRCCLALCHGNPLVHTSSQRESSTRCRAGPAAMDKDYLSLKRAAASRPSGEWNDDDFDVLADGTVVVAAVYRFGI